MGKPGCGDLLVEGLSFEVSCSRVEPVDRTLRFSAQSSRPEQDHVVISLQAVNES